MRAAARGAATAAWPRGREGPGKETERKRSDEDGGPGRALPGAAARCAAARAEKARGTFFITIDEGAGLFSGRNGPKTPAAKLRQRALLFEAARQIFPVFTRVSCIACTENGICCDILKRCVQVYGHVSRLFVEV